jgi:mRNA interferase HigB
MQLWTSNQQLQNGKFTIQKVLGGGGYGVTYSAIEKNTNNIVAIKTLNPIHQSKVDFEQQQVKEAWYRVVNSASWRHLDDVRQIYPSADAVGNFTVFNLKGNTYRLIVDIDYETQTIYYKYFLTHAEYDKDKWKKNPYF